MTDSGMTDVGVYMCSVGSSVFSVGEHPPKDLPSVSTGSGIHCLLRVCGLQNFRLADIWTLGFILAPPLPWILRLTKNYSISFSESETFRYVVCQHICNFREVKFNTDSDLEKGLFWKVFLFWTQKKEHWENIKLYFLIKKSQNVHIRQD